MHGACTGIRPHLLGVRSRVSIHLLFYFCLKKREKTSLALCIKLIEQVNEDQPYLNLPFNTLTSSSLYNCSLVSTTAGEMKVLKLKRFSRGLSFPFSLQIPFPLVRKDKKKPVKGRNQATFSLSSRFLVLLLKHCCSNFCVIVFSLYHFHGGKMLIITASFTIYINCSHFGDGRKDVLRLIKWTWVFF